ncbi:eCIS core domain-containing protein [Massilia horti]|uniref:DUF4157 domain-containing protein n=1 Tax=Massilia horti TaxID=2562153 RepID=A0A4Y9T469_9BURK|nr:DUF4157 domain-containing protein [Massilia horti]TFW31750.1 DUF4157 domain-containing protein [Massilia horti]
MNKSTLARQLAAPKFSPAIPVQLRRKCSCGAHTVAGATCATCANKRPGVQSRLAIGASGDPLEVEADRIAAQVLSTPGKNVVGRAGPSIQRVFGPSGKEAERAPVSVDRVLASSGVPLAPPLQQDMEKRFSHDFSRVRVHADVAAERSARDVGANAYTAGHHIAFGAGRFAPATHEGQRLLAHELAHVVQQSRNGSSAMPTVMQRDTAGGGATEFQDQVTTVSRPPGEPGIVEGTIARTETFPASGATPAKDETVGEMHVSFDPSDCSVTLPYGYKFVQAARAAQEPICADPPPTTAVPPLAAAAFNRLKANMLEYVNRGLNGWFNVRLSGNACPTGCSGRPLPIRVQAREDDARPDTTINVVNRSGRADSGTICAGSFDPSTLMHEAGHQILGVGDEYLETNEHYRASKPEWFRPERVRRDYSTMGPEEQTRFAMFHERHFNAVKVFLEGAFPGCSATLEALPRPVIPDYRINLGVGYASLGGAPGEFFAAGLRIGIPLDRLRRWEVVVGPQFTAISARGESITNAFLLGARLGMERSTGEAGHGFVAEAFGEAGYGRFSSGIGAASHSSGAPYGALGLSAGYRTPMLDGMRFDFRLESAAGTALGAEDPERSRWFRLGVTVGTQF